jgi:Ca-activated chloride channel family protein
MNIEMLWDKLVVPAENRSKRSLLIELTALGQAKEKKKDRTPVNLALVIDRSGSMSGPYIEAAKIAAMGIAERLTTKDRLSLVSFDNRVQVHFSNLSMDSVGRRRAKSTIAELYVGATTNLSAGWFEGARCVTEAIDNDNFQNGHVLVLSDGMANVGIQDPEELKMHAQELASRGVFTSAVGIGAYYSPLQLDALAEGGAGRLHDTENPEDIIDVVLGELGEISNTVARNVELYIRSPRGVRLECLSSMREVRSGNFRAIHVGMMQLNRMKTVALLTKVSEHSKGKELPFEVYVTWEDIDSGEQHQSATVNSVLRVVSSREAEKAEVNTEAVRKFADLWEASLAYQGMILNEQNDFLGARELYDQNMEYFYGFVDSLEDRDSRVNRYKSTIKRMGTEWNGRSKRVSYSLSKKMMLNEPDLRQKDSGNWHDRLSE